MSYIAQNAFRLNASEAKKFEHIIAREMMKAAPHVGSINFPTKKPTGNKLERKQAARAQVLQFVTDEWKSARQIHEESGISIGKVRHRLSAMLIDGEVEMQRGINNETLWIKALDPDDGG